MTLKNYFELFGLPVQSRIDAKVLEAAYQALQQRVHPDKFADASEADQRVSMQWATAVNEAYQNLRHPLRRAVHLLNVHGYDVQAQSNTAMVAEFLIQQMQWRESLEEARQAKDEAKLLVLQSEVKDAQALQIEHITRLLDETREFELATVAVRELMFIEKFKTEVGDAIDQLAP